MPKKAAAKDAEEIEDELEIPSDKDIRKNIKSIDKEMSKEIRSDSEQVQLKLLKRTSFIISVALLLLFILSLEAFWNSVGIAPPPVQREFIFHSCRISGFPECRVDIHGSDAVLEIGLLKNTLNNITFPSCENILTNPNGTVILNNCTLSSFYNSMGFNVEYIVPQSGLVHRKSGKATKIYEITTIKYFYDKIFNKIDSMKLNQTAS